MTYNLLIINPDKTNLLKQIQKRRNTRPEDEQEDGDLDFPIEDEKIFKDADQIQIPKEVISTRDKSSSPERDHNDDQTRQISISNNKFYQKETDFTDYPKLVNSRLGNFEPEPIPIIDRKTGPGEYGKELILGGSILTADRVQASIAEYGFNIVASDQISLDRNPADLRHDECKHWDYPNVMDIARHDVAVILVFHNEAFSTLVRTVHSVFNQSPPELLREIIMIDDGSNKQDLGDKLEEYVNLPKWHGKVKLFRNSERHGLIRARCDGARKASAEILVYLDAHCEAGPNWLLPLIMPIIKDRKACTCPLVDVIDGNKYTFTAQAGGDSDGFARGAWDWDLLWKRVPLTHREKAKRSYTTEPYASPAMAGGLFAINKDWFFEMGLYDEELEIWGGENFELSYKLWMCGGKLLFVPCSRVGHIYRLPGWRGNPPQKSVHANFAMRNYRRVIDTWWDGYAKYFYERRPEAKRVDAGDLTVPRSIRTKLQCKSFEWFMTEIAYDIPLRYPLVVPDNGAEGSLKLKHESYNEKCLDARNGAQGREIKLSPCSERRQYSGPKSMLTWHEDIRAGNNKNDINERKLCLDCTGIDKAITLWECHGQGGNQLFKFHPEKNRLIHAISDGCVTGDVEKGLLYVRRCEEGNIFQEWDWENVNEDQLRKFNSDAKRAVIVKEIDDI